jgi:hypothetical protein
VCGEDRSRLLMCWYVVAADTMILINLGKSKRPTLGDGWEDEQAHVHPDDARAALSTTCTSTLSLVREVGRIWSSRYTARLAVSRDDLFDMSPTLAHRAVAQ